MKRAAIAAALIGALGVSAVASDSSADWQTLRYGPLQHWDMQCSAGGGCEVTLARGEMLNGGQFIGETENGSALWQHSSFIEGVQTRRGMENRPHLTFVPTRAGLFASAMVATDHHMYRFLLHSVDGNKPTYAGFVYPSTIATPQPVTRHPVAFSASARYVSFYRQQPAPTPLPMDAAAQMARACASMRNEQYGLDLQPAEWRPARVCHSSSRTFIQLAASDTVPTDVPIPREVTPTGDANLVWTYDSASRIYGVDLVPNEIVLTLGSGRRQMRMRVQRQQKTPSPVVVVNARR
jgi:hypothetical protein